MTTRSKRTKQIVFIILVLLFLIGLLLAPLLTHAADNSRVCARIDNFKTRSAAEMGRREQGLVANRAKRDEALTNRVEKRDQQIAEERAKFDANLEQHIAKLKKRATTTEQTNAVIDFANTTQDALAARRAGVDESRQIFRTGVKSAITTRRAEIDKALSDFQAAVSTAINKASADCAAGVDPSTIRSDLRTAITAARDSLKADRLSVDRVGPVVKELAATRRSAVNQAKDTFRSAVDSARAKLKEILGVRAG